VDWYRREYVDGRENVAPASRAEASVSLRRTGYRAVRAAAAAGLVAMTVIFLAALDAGGRAEDLRTIAITSLLGLTLFAALSSDPEAEATSFASLTHIGWLLAGGLLALALNGPYNPLHLVHSDLELVFLSTAGAGLGVSTGAASRRLLRERLSERPSDSGG
jgi:hypothetical protein